MKNKKTVRIKLRTWGEKIETAFWEPNEIKPHAPHETLLTIRLQPPPMNNLSTSTVALFIAMVEWWLSCWVRRRRWRNWRRRTGGGRKMQKQRGFRSEHGSGRALKWILLGWACVSWHWLGLLKYGFYIFLRSSDRLWKIQSLL